MRTCVVVDRKLNYTRIMKNLNYCAEKSPRYNAPDIEVVEICVERGFELSSDGFGLGDGTSYDEGDVNW